MSTRTRSRGAGRRQTAASSRAAGARKQARRRLFLVVGLGVAASVVVLAVIFRETGGGSGGAGGPDFEVGQPATGADAPPIQLDRVGGGTWDLRADGAGKTVLLYFQEGVGCQPCWDQITEIEASFDRFRDLGIDELVSISVDPPDVLQQKVADEGITSVALSDPDVSLGPSYGANQFGMMGDGFYGHSFIVVGPDGRIDWRADYGGPPDHTMFVAVHALLDDLGAGLAG